MNEKFEKLLDLLIEGIEKGTELAKSELPKLAEEILKYEAWSHSAWMYFWIAVIIICVIVSIVGWIGEEISVFGFFIFLSIICLAGIFQQYSQVKEIEIAPKFYLLEMLRSQK